MAIPYTTTPPIPGQWLHQVHTPVPLPQRHVQYFPVDTFTPEQLARAAELAGDLTLVPIEKL